MQRTFTSFLSTLFSVILGCLIPLTVKAQVTTDGTTSTTVNQDGNDFTIDQGDRIGDNLFHSFNEFSVPTQGSAAFNNAGDIANIFSRVTGSSISSIDGLLSANGAANLFLINPNGIIFGENASLNLGGSFFASTADSLLFEGNSEFSASNPQAAPLLEVSIPIGLSFRDNPGDIINRSLALNNTFTDFVGLEVAPGKNLTLVGGNINFETGQATARGGNIQLGGLSTAGIVGINENGSLNFPENVSQADIFLNNFADVDVRGTGGGSITINAGNLNLEGEFVSSFIRAGITADSTSADAQAGDITINVTDNVTVDNSSISNQVDSEAVGNAGGVTIATGNLTLTNGGIVSASTLGRGNAGSVDITASDTITFDGEASNGIPSGAGSQVNSNAVGNAGGVTITTGNLTLTNGGIVSASTLGRGNAGAVNITASDTITFNGEDSRGFASGVISQVEPEAEGDAGGVSITTGSLSLTNGGRVSAGTFGQGNAGAVNITASDTITFNGEDSKGFTSGANTGVSSGAEGDAGGVSITTGSLFLTNGGRVDASTFGQGNAGSVNITASDTITFNGEDSRGFSASGAISTVQSEAEGDAGGVKITTGNLNLTNGGQVSASTFGQGDAGSVNITATDTITFDGEASNGIPSGAGSQVNSNAVGNARGITIATGSLTLSNGGVVDASTLGRGNAGLINITASDTITIDGETLDGFSSGAISGVAPGVEGDSGGVTINTSSLSLRNGGVVDASTRGQGNAGSVNITASDTITIDGGVNSGDFTSGAYSQVSPGAEGDAKGVSITTGSLFLTNGGRVDASTSGQGNAGSVEITATDTISFDGENSAGFSSGAGSTVQLGAEGEAGGVSITTGSLSLTSGGRFDASTSGQGNAGSVEITATDTITFDGASSEGVASGATSGVDSEAEGNAGGVSITTGSLFLTNGGLVDVSTLGQGNAGSVEITASDTITFDGEDSDGIPSSVTSQVGSGAKGEAGGVTITTGSLSLTNGGNVGASTFGQGDAGSVNITATDTITFDGETSGGIASGAASGVDSEAEGDAGGVTITTSSLNVTNGGRVDASTLGQGNAGSVEITASDTIKIDGATRSEGIPSRAISRVDSEAVGDAGGVTIATGSLTLTNGGQVNASTFGQGNGGNVTVNARESIAISGISENNRSSGIFAVASTVNGIAGDVNVLTNQLTIDDSAEISVSSLGLAGNLNIKANSLSQNRGAITSETGLSEGDVGANINLEISDIWNIENESIVSATAFGDADGGNININQGLSNTEFLLFAFPPTGANGSDIIANAEQGIGGRIDITAAGVFGIEFREERTPLNDFTVSSQFGTSGETIINRTVEDPTSGLIELPASVSDASDQISQNPCEQGVGSEFTVTGKGGLPPNVNESFNSESTQVGLIEPLPKPLSYKEKEARIEGNDISTDNSTSKAVPAMGWVFNDKGEVTLTAYSTSDTEIQRSPQQPSNTCSASSFENH